MVPDIGRVVISKAGRDKGNVFVIVGVIDENYVLICDGKIRKVTNPKKKKIKHLIFQDYRCEEIMLKIKENKAVTNSEIRKNIDKIKNESINFE